MQKKTTRTKDATINIRIQSAVKARMIAAGANARPYAISLTQIINRGIELAIEEIERKQ